jgi:hypothetical protein
MREPVMMKRTAWGSHVPVDDINELTICQADILSELRL